MLHKRNGCSFRNDWVPYSKHGSIQVTITMHSIKHKQKKKIHCFLMTRQSKPSVQLQGVLPVLITLPLLLCSSATPPSSLSSVTSSGWLLLCPRTLGKVPGVWGRLEGEGDRVLGSDRGDPGLRLRGVVNIPLPGVVLCCTPFFILHAATSSVKHLVKWMLHDKISKTVTSRLLFFLWLFYRYGANWIVKKNFK